MDIDKKRIQLLAEVERRGRGEDIILLFWQSLKENTEEVFALFPFSNVFCNKISKYSKINALLGLETTAAILLLPYLFRTGVTFMSVTWYAYAPFICFFINIGVHAYIKLQLNICYVLC